MKLLVSLIIAIIFSCCLQADPTDFDYLNHGQSWAISGAPSYKFCGSGTFQSPVDVGKFSNRSDYTDLHYFFAKYIKTGVKATYYNTTILIEPNSTDTGFGRIYTVLPNANKSAIRAIFLGNEIRFRSESEHVVNGVRYPLEVQIYHQV